MYKRWMTFFLILIFMPIHLSIAEKIMRIKFITAIHPFYPCWTCHYFYMWKKVWLVSHSENLSKDILKCFLSYALLFLFYIMVNFLGPTQSDTTQAVQSFSLSWSVLFVDLCVLAPVTEEIFMRGMLQGIVFKNTYFGLFATSLLFAYLHGPLYYS